MSERTRPWWASDADGAGADHEDPLAAHRAARSGRERGRDGAGTGADRGAGAGRGRPPAMDEALAALGEAARAVRDGLEEGDAGGASHRHDGIDACRICPVCAAIRVLGETRPELVEHLSEAARHLTMAAKAFVDAQAAAYGPDDELEHIELDDEPGSDPEGTA